MLLKTKHNITMRLFGRKLRYASFKPHSLVVMHIKPGANIEESIVRRYG